MSEQYEVLAVRYGTRQASAAEVFLNYHAYHEPDRPLAMDYFFWVARNQARTVVIDTGFSPASAAAATAAAVILMLPDSAVVRAVLAGLALAPGTIVVDMSSSEPLVTRELAAEVGRGGVTLVDAPACGPRPRRPCPPTRITPRSPAGSNPSRWRPGPGRPPVRPGG